MPTFGYLPYQEWALLLNWVQKYTHHKNVIFPKKLDVKKKNRTFAHSIIQILQGGYDHDRTERQIHTL